MPRISELPHLPSAQPTTTGRLNRIFTETGQEPALGTTCLFCSHETVQAEARALGLTGNPVRRSGEDLLPADYTRVTADQIQGKTKVAVRAEGDVIIERNDEILNAQWADYDQAANTVTAGNKFKLAQNGSTVSGNKITYNLTDSTGTSDYVRVDAEQEGRRLQSVSRQAEMKGKGLYKLIETKFNTCFAGRRQLVYQGQKHRSRPKQRHRRSQRCFAGIRRRSRALYTVGRLPD